MNNKEKSTKYALNKMKKVFDELHNEELSDLAEEVLDAAALFLGLPKEERIYVDCFFDKRYQFITAKDLITYSSNKDREVKNKLEEAKEKWLIKSDDDLIKELG